MFSHLVHSSSLADLGADIVKPYMVESTMVNQTIELQHGASKKLWQMDKVSNSPFEPVSARVASTPVSHLEETERISSFEKYLRNRECQTTLKRRPRAKRGPHGAFGYPAKDRGEAVVMSWDWETDMII